jgi:RND family efflux transporter MFP subunit
MSKSSPDPSAGFHRQKRLPWSAFFCLLPLSLTLAHGEPLTVPVGVVARSDGYREVSFDAELRPYQEIELHSKVTGFIDAMKVEVGDVMKEGQLIASLDIPESKIELEHAVAEERRSHADLDRASATYDEAHLTFTRISATDHAQPHLIAAQELDTARVHDRSTAAALESAKEQVKVAESEVKRYQTMVDYTRITAPFAGVITKRHADVGTLIQAGTSSGTSPVVRLSQNDKLRVVFPVSISFVSQIRVGDPVEVRIPSLDRTIKGAVARFTRKVETSTRTMEAEVDLPNEDLALIPGIYAVAVLKIDVRNQALFVPIESIQRAATGSSVYVINSKNLVEERQVTLGLELPNKVEVLSGANENEMVLMGSRARLSPGQSVLPKVMSSAQMN